MDIRNLTKITFSFVEFYHISKTLEHTPGIGEELQAILAGTQMVLAELDLDLSRGIATGSQTAKAELDVTFPLDVLEELAKIIALRKPSQDARIGLETELTYQLAGPLVHAVVQARRAQVEVSSSEIIGLAREWKPGLFATATVASSGIGPDDEVYPVADATPRNIGLNGKSRF